MALLSPLLIKAGEKAFETIGEKLAEKSLEKSFWLKIKAIFILDQEQAIIEAIEKKPVATSQEIAMIEQKVNNAVVLDPQLAVEIKESLQITPLNEFFVSQKVQSINRLHTEISSLEVQMERAGIGTAGDYINKIELQRDKLNYQVTELKKLLYN